MNEKTPTEVVNKIPNDEQWVLSVAEVRDDGITQIIAPSVEDGLDSLRKAA